MEIVAWGVEVFKKPPSPNKCGTENLKIAFYVIQKMIVQVIIFINKIVSTHYNIYYYKSIICESTSQLLH